MARDAEVIDALHKYHRNITSQPAYRAYNELVDFTQASELQLTAHCIVELSRMASKTDSHGVKTKLAIVVSSNLGYGLGRMYQTYRNMMPGTKKELGVFRNLRDALEWIGKKQSAAQSGPL